MRRLLAALFLMASTACMAQAAGSYVTVQYLQSQSVASINGTVGAFTFSGAGVSCTTTTCTFSGTGGGNVSTTTPNTYTAGKTQTFISDATNPGFVLGAVTVDPSSSPVGGCWYRSDLGQISCQGPAGVLRMVASSGSGPLTLTGQTSSSLPTAPAAGNGTFFISSTFVGQTENPSGAVSGTQVVPRAACPAGQHVANIDVNGVQQCSADATATVMVASGASHAAGLAPDPGAVAGTTKFLREDATWQVPAGGGGVSLSPSASQTILAANTTTTPLGTDTPASPTVDVFFVKIAGSSKIRVDQFGTIQLDGGTLNSNSGVNFSAGGSFSVNVNKNGTTDNFNTAAGWAGSAIAGDVVAVTSGTHAVADCATSCVNAYGVVQQTPNANDFVQTAGQVTVNLDATFSPVGGWFACSSAVTAGKAIVQAAACAAGRQIGYVTQAGTSVTTIPIVLQFK